MALEIPKTLKHKIDVIARNAVMTREMAREALSCLDLTSLQESETKEDIHDLCDVAKVNRVASVCIYPDMVLEAA